MLTILGVKESHKTVTTTSGIIVSVALVAITAFALLATTPVPTAATVYEPSIVHDVDLLDNGNILVSEGGVPMGTASGVYEIDLDGNIIWSYATGLDWTHNADMQPDSTVIISDTDNDRVIIVDRDGTLVWDTDTITFSDGSTLDYPNDANLLTTGNVLITDRDNHRIFETELDGTVVWQFGDTGIPGGGPFRLNGPHNADRLTSGNTIVADSNNDRIFEVSPAGIVVWSYAGGLAWPRDADRLASGNTLINDSDNNRILEVTPAGATAWEYTVPDVSYDSDRLASGNTLIASGSSILEVDPAGLIVWSFPSSYTTEVVDGYLVTAPNGNVLWTKIIQPEAALYPGETFPAVVCMTGGLGEGEGGNNHVADDGIIEFHFNAEGRGTLHPSGGVEDYNGTVHQDDLRAVIEFALSRENVDIENVGVITGSYGITAGAGCLGRYPGLPVKYLIDLEGPSESFVTCKDPWSLDADPTNDKHAGTYAIFGHWSTYRDSTAANVAWWAEREATNYIGDIQCRYLRFQAEWDHAQPPNALWPLFDYPPLWYQCKHAVDLVNLAVAGDSPWVRVNRPAEGNAVNATYAYVSPPVYATGTMASYHGLSEELILEMAGMAPLAGSDVANEIPASSARLLPAYPNPFNPLTLIPFELDGAGHVALNICDIAGRHVRTLVERDLAEGPHTATWDGLDDNGRAVSSGVYFSKLKVVGGLETSSRTGKLVLLR